MYRRMALVVLLLLAGLTAGIALGYLPVSAPLQALRTGLFLSLPAWARPENVGGGPGMAVILLLGNLAPLVVVVGAIWLSALHPGRRYSAAAASLRYGLAIGVVGLALVVLYMKADRAAGAIMALATQSARPPIVIFAANQLPHAAFAWMAVAMILAAPLYTLARTLQVGGMRRATFEAWAELRRHLLVAGLLLAVAALVEVYLTPAVTTWLLR
jgi:hypothetical protein